MVGEVTDGIKNLSVEEGDLGIRVEANGLFGDPEIEDIITDRVDLLALPNFKGLIYDDFHNFGYYFFGVK